MHEISLKKWTAPSPNQLWSSNYVSDEWTIHTSWVNAHRMNGVISGSISRGSTYQTFVFIVKFKCYNNRSTKGAVDVLPLHSWGLLVSGPSYYYSPWYYHLVLPVVWVFTWPSGPCAGWAFKLKLNQVILLTYIVTDWHCHCPIKQKNDYKTNKIMKIEKKTSFPIHQVDLSDHNHDIV